MVRDDAYRIVQSCAATAIETGKNFREVLSNDPRVTLPAGALDAAFDAARVLRHASRGVAALDAIAL
jgi:adenylosuccinate lyase